jgi:hypothetical protein
VARRGRKDDSPDPERQGWEYKLVSMGNPLEPDVEVRANALGKQGWELTAIDAGVWVFKRPFSGDEAPTGLEAVFEETVPLAEPTAASVPAGSPPLTATPSPPA